MKWNAKKSFIGSFIALAVGSSCCWLTTLAVWLGGATVLSLILTHLADLQIYFIVLGILLLSWGVLLIYRSKL